MKVKEIELRRSIRKFRPEPVPEKLLRQALEAARLAPSAKNDQPWRFLVLGPESRERCLSAMERGIREGMASGGNRAYLAGAAATLRIMKTAPALVLIVRPVGTHPYGEIAGLDRVLELLDAVSVGAAVENLLLEAEALGLGTLWIGNTFLAYDAIVEAMAVDGQLLGAVALGYPDEHPLPRPRKSFDEIAAFLP